MRMCLNRLGVATAAGMTAAAVGALIMAVTMAIAPAQTMRTEAAGTLAANEGYLFDGESFGIVRGGAKGDVSGLIAKLNAKEVGPGVIVFRVGDKIYIAQPGADSAPSPEAIKKFQDDWAVSYMRAMKNFQDNWISTYMNNPNFQEKWAIAYMKDFQDKWTVSYIRTVRDLQGNWTVGYMKNFQDNWNGSRMKTLKEFQDNWATSYR